MGVTGLSIFIYYFEVKLFMLFSVVLNEGKNHLMSSLSFLNSHLGGKTQKTFIVLEVVFKQGWAS